MALFSSLITTKEGSLEGGSVAVLVIEEDEQYADPKIGGSEFNSIDVSPNLGPYWESHV